MNYANVFIINCTNLQVLHFLNCTKLQVIRCLTAQICKKYRYADVNQRSGCRGTETMVISLCSVIFPDKSGCKPQRTQ